MRYKYLRSDCKIMEERNRYEQLCQLFIQFRRNSKPNSVLKIQMNDGLASEAALIVDNQQFLRQNL